MKKDYSTILLSIFRRKGGEGDRTKIIDDNNRVKYDHLFPTLEQGEKSLLICIDGDKNFFLLTNKRVIIKDETQIIFIPLLEISSVRPAFDEEFKKNILNKKKFTKLSIKTSNNNEYVCNLEMGLPYTGILQALSYIAGKE